MNWISVNDSLPGSEDYEVLVRQEIDEDWLQYDVASYDNENDYWYEVHEYRPIGNVTHWCYISFP